MSADADLPPPVGVLTPDRRILIDRMDYEEMLQLWRFAGVGEPLFVGEVGAYFYRRMINLKQQDPAAAVRASKNIGWETRR